MRGRALEDSGRRAGLLEGVFIACVRRVVNALRLQHAGAPSTPVQAGGEQETIGAPLGRAVRKSGGPRGSKPFCTVVLFSGLPDRLYITARLQHGKASNTARTELHVSSDDLPVSALSRSGILLQNIKIGRAHV